MGTAFSSGGENMLCKWNVGSQGKDVEARHKMRAPAVDSMPFLQLWLLLLCKNCAFCQVVVAQAL